MITLILAASVLNACLAAQGAPSAPATQAPTGAAATPAELNAWPQQITTNGKQYTIYQPVVTGIDGARAYLVTEVAMESAAGGRITAKAQLQAEIFPADVPGEMEINSFRVRGLTVDGKPAAAADATALGQALFVVAMTIDRASLVQDMQLMNARGSSTPGLRLDPPAIVLRSTPAVLLQVAGEPSMAPLANTGWTFARNTPFTLLRSNDGLWWTRVNQAWLTAKDLHGNFVTGDAVPTADAIAAIGTLPSPPSDIPAAPRRIARPTPAKTPEVIVATKPTVLVSIDGAPKLAQVAPGAMAVTNSNAALLSADNGKSFYLLASGRWFSTTSLQNAAWKYVAPIDVPRAFTGLPRTKRWDGVRAALPGTPEANEAALAAREVRTVTLRRDAARCEVRWSGQPEFKSVPETEMKYATNASQPVIEAMRAFFCCDDGVWFVATAPQGPWTLADRLPQELFRLPPSCPAYAATYVEVYGATSDSVTYGMTAGYFGTYLNDGTPVFGTGVDYGATVAGGGFHAYPQTYGFDAQYDAQTGTFTPPDDPTDDYAYFGMPDIMPLTAAGGWGGFGWCRGWDMAWAAGWNNWWGWDHWAWWMSHWHPYYARWQPAQNAWQQQSGKDAQARLAQHALPVSQRTWPAARGAMATAGAAGVQIAPAPGATAAADAASSDAAMQAKRARAVAMQAAAENQAALARQFQGAAGDSPTAFRSSGGAPGYAGYPAVAYRPWTGEGSPLGGNWGYSPLAGPNGFHPPQQFATPGAYWGAGTAAGNSVGPNAGPYSTPQGHGGWGSYDHWAGEGLGSTQFTGYSNQGSP